MKLEAYCQVRRGGGEQCSGERVGCRGGGLQARREARERWRDGAAARAYIEHVFHARDLRDVPVQGLVEVVGKLPGAEREARKAQACVGCSGGGLQARWEARVRRRDGGAARAYQEHSVHARDLRDVPVQGLVDEAPPGGGGAGAQARGCGRRAAAAGGSLRWREGQRPRRPRGQRLRTPARAGTWPLRGGGGGELACGVHCRDGRLQARREARVCGGAIGGSGPGIPGTFCTCS